MVAVIPSQQNWKVIGISLFVILAVIGLVAFAVFLKTPTDTGPRIKGARIKLVNFTSGILQPSRFNASWHSGKYPIFEPSFIYFNITGSSVAFINAQGSLELLDVKTLAKKIVVSNNVFVSV